MASKVLLYPLACISGGSCRGLLGRVPFADKRDPSTGGHPYSTATDPEPMNSVLRVLSCGPEWDGAELGHEENPAVRARPDSVWVCRSL